MVIVIQRPETSFVLIVLHKIAGRACHLAVLHGCLPALRPRDDMIAMPIIPGQLTAFALLLQLAHTLVASKDRQLLDVRELPIRIIDN